LAAEELMDGPREEDFTVPDQIASIDDGEDLPGVMVGDEDADSAAFEVADHCLHIADGVRVDIGKRFIEQKEGGLDDERTGDL